MLQASDINDLKCLVLMSAIDGVNHIKEELFIRNLDRFNVANVSGRLIIDTGTIIESPRAPGMSVKYPQGLSCIALTTEE